MDYVINSPPSEEFPSCKSYFLRAKARFLKGKFGDLCGALEDIAEAEKLPPKNFDLN